MHTDRSDGSLSPAEVVRRAHAGGLDTIAITDHDSVGGLSEAAQAAREVGVRLIPGVEMTAGLDGHELHLLAYFRRLPDESEAAELTGFLDDVQLQRRERMRKAVRELRVRGIFLTESDLPMDGPDSLTRLHLAKALVSAGYARTEDQAFGRILNPGRARIPNLDIPPATVTEKVHALGGLVVWAHPRPEEYGRFLEPLLDAGLDGVETHNFRRRDTAGRLYDDARQRGLLTTGGSDWHGTPREMPLGTHAVAPQVAERFLAALESGGAR